MPRKVDGWMCRVQDWATDHAALLWGIALLVVFPLCIAAISGAF